MCCVTAAAATGASDLGARGVDAILIGGEGGAGAGNEGGGREREEGGEV